MIHLRNFSLSKWPDRLDSQFPFNLPIIQTLELAEFDSPVTYFVGENGTGKSTLLEALACAVNSITVGTESVATDATLGSVRELSRFIKLTWNKRTQKGFFLRAEDFFGYAKKMARTREEFKQDLKRLDDEYQGRSQSALHLARMPIARELGDIERSYGEGLDGQSHGESFLTLFQNRFIPAGLYLLDEPEAPLSPIRQLSFLSLLKDMVMQEAQFIISTHSPLIMAFPDAEILSFDSGKIHPVSYDELEHVSLTRDFLNNPEAFIKHL